MHTNKTIHINAKYQAQELNELAYFRFLKEHAHFSASTYAYAFSLAIFKAAYIVYKFSNDNMSFMSLFVAGILMISTVYMIVHTVRHSEDPSFECTELSHFVYNATLYFFIFNDFASLFSLFGILGSTSWSGYSIFVLFDFFFEVAILLACEMKRRIQARNIVISGGVAIILYLAAGIFSDNTNRLPLFSGLYFKIENITAMLAIWFLTGAIFALIGKFINKINDARIVKAKNGAFHQNYVTIRRLNKLGYERNRQFIVLCINAICVVLNIFALINSYREGYLQCYSSLATLVATICEVITIVYAIQCIKRNNTGVFPKWYPYVLATKEICNISNLYCNLMMRFIFEGPKFDLFTPKLGLDWTALILAPILIMISNLLEYGCVNIKSRVVGTSILNLLLIIEKINNPSNITAFFIENGIDTFAGTFGQIIAMISEYLLSFCFFLMDRSFFDTLRYKLLDEHVEHDFQHGVDMYVCGARNGIAPTSPNFYEYGQASNCYVLRDGNYGMIISCGSGLVYAAEKLKGCTSVDIFLTEVRFSTMMGLLVAPNPCPGAKIRIYGPFGAGAGFVDMNGFATPPLWPVNVIVGECISIDMTKKIRLNDHYSVCYYANDIKKTGYSLCINGAIGLFYEGGGITRNSNIAKLAQDYDVIICKNDNNIEQIIEEAIKANVSCLLIGNHGAYETDTQLSKKENAVDKYEIQIDYLKQGDIYNIC